jgi:nucleoside phosphorylase
MGYKGYDLKMLARDLQHHRGGAAELQTALDLPVSTPSIVGGNNGNGGGGGAPPKAAVLPIIVIHCAIMDELDGVTDYLEMRTKLEFKTAANPMPHRRAVAKLDGKEVIIALTVNGSNNSQGTSPTMLAVEQVAAHLKPSFVFMAGICGGNPGRVKSGDVVIFEVAVNYSKGSANAGQKFRHDADKAGIPKHLDQLAATFGRDLSKAIRKIAGLPQGSQPPNVHVGAVATGEAVRNDLTEDGWLELEGGVAQKKILAVECEAFSFMTSLSERKIPFLALKGVQDTASSGVNKAAETKLWRTFSINGSAEVIWYLLENATDKFLPVL